jgi:hypothetical protein
MNDNSKDTGNILQSIQTNNQGMKGQTASELSITLLERRKRLHNLATEINQWEDESIINQSKK